MAINPEGINREARGLLDLFRAKVGGRQPDRFLKEIRTQVDAVPFLANPLVRVGVASVTTTGTATATVTIPQDECWLLYQAAAIVEGAASASQNASAYGVLKLGNIPTQGGGGTADAYLNAWDWIATDDATATQNRGASCVYTPPGHLLLQPGTTISNEIDTKNTTVSLTARVYALYSPLSV